jgi:hypothetical protein
MRREIEEKEDDEERLFSLLGHIHHQNFVCYRRVVVFFHLFKLTIIEKDIEG